MTWLQLDHVRAALSCIILACLLALIIIGGRTSTSLRLVQPKAHLGQIWMTDLPPDGR